MDRKKIVNTLANIIYKASVDKSYRNRVLKQGKKIFQEESGLTLDKNVKVRFIENKNAKKNIKANGQEIIFVLADYVGNIGKLSKEELKRVTGGISSSVYVNDSSILQLLDIIV